VDDPLLVGEDGVEAAQVTERDRVDQDRADRLSSYLDQVGALPVAVARRALGVDRHRAGSGRQRRDCSVELGQGVDDRGDAVPRFAERHCRHRFLNSLAHQGKLSASVGSF
jgi:hypothetical protein